MRALPGNRRDRLRAMLADLKMPGALEAVDGILAQADSGAATAGEAIEQLLDAQIALRNNRRLSLTIAAAESGRRVYYGTLAGLIESLVDAKVAGQLPRRLRVLTYPALLVVDEIGYLPVSQDGAVLFFQLINARHERASTVLTSNKGFEEWGSVLGDEIMAAALIDRLLHHCHIVNIRGNSYRMREHQNLMRPAHEHEGAVP